MSAQEQLKSIESVTFIRFIVGQSGPGTTMIVCGCYCSANMKRWLNVDLLSGKRRRRWANSKLTLDQRLVFAEWGAQHINVTPNKHDTFNQCRFNVGLTLTRHWFTVSCLLGDLWECQKLQHGHNPWEMAKCDSSPLKCQGSSTRTRTRVTFTGINETKPQCVCFLIFHA